MTGKTIRCPKLTTIRKKNWCIRVALLGQHLPLLLAAFTAAVTVSIHTSHWFKEPLHWYQMITASWKRSLTDKIYKWRLVHHLSINLKKKSLGLPGLVIHGSTDGLHLWIYTFGTSIQIVCARNLSIGSDCLKFTKKSGKSSINKKGLTVLSIWWIWRNIRNWGTKRPAGRPSEKVFKSIPKENASASNFLHALRQKGRALDVDFSTADTPSEWVAKTKRKVRAGETWWNIMKQPIFQVIRCCNCPCHFMPIWPHLSIPSSMSIFGRQNTASRLQGD